MRFAQPGWLWIGLAACTLLTVLMLWSARRRRQALARFSARPAQLVADSVSKWRRGLKGALLLMGTSALFAALARPQWGYHEEVRREQGVDLLFALDTSKSMLAEDLRPNRLARAKLAIEELLSRVPGDRLGLIAFAGDAFLQTPLTHDRTAFVEALTSLDTGAIPVGGTDLASAIRVARRALRSEPDHQKVLVLLTDGEDLSGDALAAARDAAREGLVLHTVGIGSEQGSEIALRDAHGRAELLRGPDGELVHSRLDAPLLRKLASVTGGSYHALGAGGQGLNELYRDQLGKLAPHTRTVHKTRVYDERFQWLLALGLNLLSLEWLVGDRKARGRVDGTRAAAAAALSALLSLALPGGASAEDATVGRYNDAAAQYRKGDFEQAVRNYRGALATRDLKLQERAYYDLGNALYRVGESAREKAPGETIAQYKQAIAAYDAALALESHDADARFNRDFVKQRLAELEQQQVQTQPQQGGESKPQQDAKPDSQQGSSAQSEGGESKQGSSAGDEAGQGSGRGQDKQSAGAGPGRSEREGSARRTGGDEQRRQSADKAAAGAGSERPDQPAERQPKNEAEGAQRGDSSEARSDAQQGDTQAAVAGSDGEHKTALTRAEAEQLLDALQGELRRLPSHDAHTALDDRVRKDW